ncbi:MAG: Gfo/Idh/MocA family oxidoreductase [Deltaproteobacteria bacterium]|nr:Gfo/Idh/MocA family oxidoreductase [Deltaproteobacteria bacterium]
MNKKTFVIVGLGGRHELFRDAIIDQFKNRCHLLGLCDINKGRLEKSAREVKEKTGYPVKEYHSDNFDQMIRDLDPDRVIVTTKDSTHDGYICRAMELGCDVITEKPMTMDAQKCKNILDTQKKTGRKITVTFNYRYSPPRTQVKELLMDGVIGKIISIDFNWLLDTYHGADYFRRWHRNKINSGGLLVHKATHHFDLVNWWISSVPETVYAKGARCFYTPQTAERLGLNNRASRCHICAEAGGCPFYLGLKHSPSLKSLYLDNENHDGYFRDQCVFNDQTDIEDTVSVLVEYMNNVRLNYSLTAFSPWEGYIINFNGTEGRIEHRMEETVYINADGTVPGKMKKDKTKTTVYPLRKEPFEVDIWEGEGGHGGADPQMLRYIFDPENQPADKYMRSSDHRSGAWSIITGIAANKSMELGRPVKIDELISGMELPEILTERK